MQWRRRRCCTNIAALLFFLSCVGALLILCQQSLLVKNSSSSSSSSSSYIQEKGKTPPSQNLQMPRSESNQSTIKRDTQREETVSTLLWRSVPNHNSFLENSSRRGPKNIEDIVSDEVRAREIQKVEPYKYIINEADKCRGREIFLVLLIPMHPLHVNVRDAIRQTWGNESLAGGLGFVRLFLLGVKEGIAGHVQRSIEAESRQHRDIIQQEYTDSYNNLTIKTLMGMYWVATYCPTASYAMKVDSDMFVNTEYLIQKLLKPGFPPRSKYFTGYIMRGYSPIRNKGNKWYMSPEMYPGEHYPTFCSGTGYVFSGDVAPLIYNASLSVQRLHLEDVYIGICLAKLGIEPQPPPNEFLFNHWRVSYSSCKYSHLITSHEFLPTELIRYWQHFQSNKNNACINMRKEKH